MKTSELIKHLEALMTESGEDLDFVMITETGEGAFMIEPNPVVDIFQLPRATDLGERFDQKVIAVLPHLCCANEEEKAPHLTVVK